MFSIDNKPNKFLWHISKSYLLKYVCFLRRELDIFTTSLNAKLIFSRKLFDSETLMELNVKQSGIEQRILTTKFIKTRSGKITKVNLLTLNHKIILKRVHELYLRNDIPCGN